MLLVAAFIASLLVVLGGGLQPAGASPVQVEPEQEQECTLLDCLDPPTSTTVRGAETSTSTTARETTTTSGQRTTTTTGRATVTTSAAEETEVEEETTTSEATVTTISNLLVPGDGTRGAESTTTTAPELIAATDDDGPSDGTLIALVIAGLVVVALAVGILTWRYWAATRPPVIDEEPTQRSRTPRSAR